MWNTSSKKTDPPLKIGITGGIGSGKSVVCALFSLLGIPVFEADQVAKKLMNSDSRLRRELVDLFGEAVYTAEGVIDRKMLAGILFNDQLALQKVNSLVHPAVREAFLQWCSEQTSPYVLHEAAILFESGFFRMMDRNILVTAPEELRIRRVTTRDGVSAEAVLQRMQNQWTDEEKIPLADFIISNDDTRAIIPQVLDIDKQIRKYGKIC